MAAERLRTSLGNASQTTLVQVWATVVPSTVAEVGDAIRRSSGRLSVSSARYSPDRQFALEGALHIDMSRLNQVIRFEPLDAVLRVQAGMRWHEVLQFIQPHGFSPKVMPQFANFSIGGSVASNAHGHYVGTGPLSSSIRSLRVVLADGSVADASRSETPELFSAVVGGFGGLGVIVEVELDLAVNTPIMRKSVRLPAEDYVDYFKARIATDPGAVFHSAELHAPGFRRLRATTWVRSGDRCTENRPLNVRGIDDPRHTVFGRSPQTSWFGRVRDEYVVDPIRFARKSVHWRNFEAGHDLMEFDPGIHDDPSLELQEYVIAPGMVLPFLARLKEVVARYKVPAVHLSVCHYGRCEDSCLSLAESDSFAFLLAVRVRPLDQLKADYAVWSRELVDAALDGGGSFNPAYQMHATPEQFSRAFRRRAELLRVKKRFDPGNRFGNGLWSRYLTDAPVDATVPAEASEFRAAFADAGSRDGVYRLLAECGPRGQASRMLGLLERMSQRSSEDELIYRNMRSTLQKWRGSPLAGITMRSGDWQRALHRRLALFTRDRLQANEVPAGGRLDGMLDVASGGRQLKALRRHLTIDGFIRQIDDFGCRPAESDSRWLEARLPARMCGDALYGGAARWDESSSGSAAGGVGLITLYGGLSGLAPAELPRCLAELFRDLRPGGLVLLLEHDVETAHAGLDASLAVTLAFLCAGESWEASRAHPRAFRAGEEWAALMQQNGLVEAGPREHIERSPFGDLLLAFKKPASAWADADDRVIGSTLDPGPTHARI